MLIGCGAIVPIELALYNVSVMKEKTGFIRKPDIRKALIKGLREGYFNLGFVLFSSAITTMITFSLAWIISAAFAFLGPWQLPLYLLPMLAGWICAVGIYDYVYKVLEHQHPAVQEIWGSIKALAAPAIGLFALDSFITAVLISDLIYCSMLAMKSGGLALTALAVLCFYVLLIWVMMTMYHLPLLVSWGPGSNVLDVIRKGFVLTFAAPVFTLVLFLAIIAFAIVCALPLLAGIVALFTGGSAFLICSALRELYISVGVKEDETSEPVDRGWSSLDK